MRIGSQREHISFGTTCMPGNRDFSILSESSENYIIHSRLANLTLAVRETGVSAHNGDPIKGPPQNPSIR